jgi:hypothetical protein
MSFPKVIAVTALAFICFRSGIVAQEKKDSVRTLLLPEFYHNPQTENDTTYSYEFYDKNDKMVNVNTLVDLNNIEHVNYLKSFYQSKNTGGSISSPYLSKKLKTYLKVNDDTWGEIDQATKDYTQLKERKNKIVRKDTAAYNDFKTGNKILVIRKYYKVTEEKGGQMPAHHR